MTSFEKWYVQHKADLFDELDISVDCNLVVYRYLMLAFLNGVVVGKREKALDKLVETSQALGGYEAGASS